MPAALPDRYDADTSIAPHDPDGALTVRVAEGPTDWFHGVAGLGFAGTHAIAFRGVPGAGEGADAGAAPYRVTLHEVDEPITADTELSYVIGFRLDADRTYAGGHVALDVLLDDGTRISELGAVDQLAFPLTADGQGDSKAVLPHQWNLRRSRLGALAAGRRAVAVELVWDAAPALAAGGIEVSGHVDRIRLGEVPVAVPDRPVDRVITTRGTHSNATFSRGNNLPAAAWPNGFTFFTPVTDARTLRWVYSWSDHNGPDNRPRLQALAVSHQPSPWMGDRLAFQVMPQSVDGPATADPAARSLGFDHEHETARPHHYRAELDGGLVAEVVPTDHTAAFRFTFPEGRGRLVFDNATADGACRITDDGEVVGWSESVPGPRADGAGRLYVVGRVDAPVTGSGSLDDGAGPDTGCHLDVGDGQGPLVVTLRLATSLISTEQARRSLDLEQGTVGSEASFETLRDRAADAWDERLAALEIDGPLADEEARTTVASHLYRLNLYPNSGHENAGTADAPRWVHASPGLDPVGEHTDDHTASPVLDGKIYLNNGFWDTYRTAWPLYTLLYPRLTAELVDGFVQHHRDAGWIPRWSSPGFADCMVGTSSDVAFADALVKGVAVDAVEAYRAAVTNATVHSPDTRMGRKSLDRGIFLGYTPSEEPEGMSWSIDNYVNDFGIAAMGRWLLDHDQLPPGYDTARLRDEVRWFEARALDYARLYRLDHGLFHGRMADGSWRVPTEEFDPDAWGDDYTETNAWTMAVSVPHDGAGLVGLSQGRDLLAELLDTLETRPETAERPGSYGKVIHEITEARDLRLGMVSHSNQPAHHVPFMWLHALRPDRTQRTVRELMRRFHQGSEIGQGYGGDEDNGEMSAWQLFAALGVYPLTVGAPSWVIGSPLYDRVRVRRDDGTGWEVIAEGNDHDHPYVAALTRDGEPVDRPWVDHEELITARTWTFTMSDAPQSWGSGEPPPSLSPTATSPRLLRDVTGTARVELAGADPSPVIDDTSATDLALAAGTMIEITTEDKVDVELITLTSATGGAPPTRWTLEARGLLGWRTIAEADGAGFDRPQQTRAFGVTGGSVSARRFRWTAHDAGRLAELELLARDPE